MIAFGIIVADVTYWQAIDASNLAARADNPRLAYQANRVQRGLIYDRNGVLLAGRTVDAQGVVHRYYTDPSLSQIIGYDSPRYDKTGLEKSYDGYLSGQVVGNSWSTALHQWEHKQVVGDNLTLTIDDQLQKQVANLLPNTPSAAIVTDPRNGEVLAMVSKPEYDANQIDTPGYWQSLLNNADAPFIDRPVSGYYPPGSTFKIVTMSAALDSGLMSPTTLFSGQDATGPLTVDGHVFPTSINNLQDCPLPHSVDTLTLTEALMCSDNIVFARVGLALGASRFLDYTHRFGLDQPTPFDIPVSVSNALSKGEDFSRIALASTAFGQGGMHVTPLQMLMAAEAPANGGTIPNPVLVKQVTDAGGSTIKTGNYGTLYQPTSSSTASAVRDAMVQVVEGQGGSGFEARIPGVQVAGKTGTAESSIPGRPHAWFVCFAPADHPRVAVVVVVEHVDASAGAGGFNVAAPLARQILQAALPLTH